MTLSDVISALRTWRFTTYKMLNMGVGLLALLLYEFVGRPIYRPFIYRHQYHDFHIADTLGNTLGTMATIFFLIGVLSHEQKHGNFLIKMGTLGVLVFELAHPLLGKPIDVWDLVATLVSGFISYGIYHTLFIKR